MKPTESDQIRPETLARYDKAITALLQFSTEAEACESIGIHRSTLHEWKKNARFQERYREAQRSLYEHALGQLQAGASEAVQTLRDVMADPEAQDSARVSAAKAVLDLASKRIDQQDLEERIRALEEAQGDGA